MAFLVPKGKKLGDYLPAGTQVERLESTWGLYKNAAMGMSWLVWSTPSGLQVMRLPGLRTVSIEPSRLEAYVKQRQATACRDCP